jgi:methyl-accepting chemotaxis protein
MKLITRILLAPLLAFIALMVVGGVSIYSLHGQTRVMNDLSSKHLEARRISNALRLEINQARAETYKLFSLVNVVDEARIKVERAALKQRFTEISQRLKELEPLSLAEDKAAIETTAATIARYSKSADDAIDMASVDVNTGVASMMSAEDKFKEANEANLALSKRYADRANNAMDGAKKLVEQSTNVIIGVVIAAIFLAALLGWKTARGIVARVVLAGASARAMAGGNLGVKFAQEGKDEISHLMHDLEDMRQKFVTLIGSVQSGAGSVNLASGEIAQGNSDLSARTETQASSLQQTAASIEQLSSTVKQSAESARLASTLAQTASDVAQKGGGVVGEVVSTMADIQTSSKKISDIIGVIDGIAFQTNILALNAAVEAARAGEQGRGFAVVATEVRSLAHRSAQAAKEIKSLISASVERVDSGSKLVDEAGIAMTEIVTSVKRVNDIIGEIASATIEQSGGIEQVNQAVGQLDQMTQQNAALVEESAAAAASLKDQAHRLSEAIGAFDLSGNSEQSNAASKSTNAPSSVSAASRGPAPQKSALQNHTASIALKLEPNAFPKAVSRTVPPAAAPLTKAVVNPPLAPVAPPALPKVATANDEWTTF